MSWLMEGSKKRLIFRVKQDLYFVVGCRLDDENRDWPAKIISPTSI